MNNKNERLTQVDMEKLKWTIQNKQLKWTIKKEQLYIDNYDWSIHNKENDIDNKELKTLIIENWKAEKGKLKTRDLTNIKS